MHRWLLANDTPTNATHHCPGGVRITKQGDRALIQYHAPDSELFSVPEFMNDHEISLHWPGLTRTDQISLETRFLAACPELHQVRTADPTQVAYLDRDTIQPPLFLRHPLHGDRFDPLGLGGHHQRMVDFLRIQGVATPDKKKTWVLCDQAGIVWVVGHRVSHRVRISSDTIHAAEIQLAAHEGGTP
jgi:hypothetical protein